jgi:hypothetical protein
MFIGVIFFNFCSLKKKLWIWIVSGSIFSLKCCIRIGIQPKMLDPDPESMNPDPKLWVRGKGPNLLFWNMCQGIQICNPYVKCLISDHGYLFQKRSYSNILVMDRRTRFQKVLAAAVAAAARESCLNSSDHPHLLI